MYWHYLLLLFGLVQSAPFQQQEPRQTITQGVLQTPTTKDQASSSTIIPKRNHRPLSNDLAPSETDANITEYDEWVFQEEEQRFLEDQERMISNVPELYRLLYRTHNLARRRYGSPPLNWSLSLEQQSQAHADRCIWEHSHMEGIGENIFASVATPTNEALHGAGLYWFNERHLYEYEGGGGYTEATSHFTQMVWRGTVDMGCAATNCEAMLGGPATKFVVCQYSPPGNVLGRFHENVLPEVTLSMEKQS
jgi:hypothetical protein